MAIMAPHVQIVKRSDGRSSVAFAAYRAAELLHDERIDHTHDYTRKSGVVLTEILAPQDATDWAKDRQKLWNEVEKAAKRKDAQLAREFMLPLPHELSNEERIALVRDFVNDTFVSKGMIADIAIHLPDRNGDQRNHHAHITCTMRHISAAGFGKQAREWNDDFAGVKKLYALKKSGKLEEAKQFEAELRKNRPIYDWREKWAKKINLHLKRAGFDHRIDHRSWSEQDIDREAEKHMGVEATHLERQGEQTRAGDERRAIQERNAELEHIQQRYIETSHALELLAQGQPVSHTQAKALDRTKQALQQLKTFDQNHGQINHVNSQISDIFSALRRFDNRKTYALTLSRQLRRNFKDAYGKNAKAAFTKFKTDIRKRGITKAARTLESHPNRYGKMRGWQIGKNLHVSRERKQARYQIVATAEIARQTFYMTRKIRAKDTPLRQDFEKRLQKLKNQQTKLMQTPPEGRLIIQRALYEIARGLDNRAWARLSRQDKFHITQARQIMRDPYVRDWADRKAEKLISNDLAPAPSKEFLLGLLSKPIDPIDISPDLKRAELENRFEQVVARHKQDLEALAAAKKAAEEGLAVKRQNITQKGFSGLLARSTGIDHLLERVFAKQKQEIDRAHKAAMRAAQTTYRGEVGAIQKTLKGLYEHLNSQFEKAKTSQKDLEREKQELDRLRRNAKQARKIRKVTFEEIKRRHEQWKRRQSGRDDQGLDYRRPNKPKDPPDPDDDD